MYDVHPFRSQMSKTLQSVEKIAVSSLLNAWTLLAPIGALCTLSVMLLNRWTLKTPNARNLFNDSFSFTSEWKPGVCNSSRYLRNLPIFEFVKWGDCANIGTSCLRLMETDQPYATSPPFFVQSPFGTIRQMF